jgi:glucose/arabinose dehydrogenase
MTIRHRSTRRLATLGLVLGVLLTLLAPHAASGAVTSISLDLEASGLDALTQVTSARDGSGRLFLAERRGTIRVFKDGTVQPGFFLDMRSRVEAGGERGLLGLAFHPSFSANGLLFVYYTRPGGDIVIARWRANADRSAVMGSSFKPLLVIEHSAATNHNGGGMAFSPRNGYLYAAVGDGGGSGDPENDALNKSRNLLGKVIRVNVNGSGAGRYDTYSVPSSNPFVGRSGLNEIWAYGLRNPWRISFDRFKGTLYVADVGQGSREELDRESANSPGGRNYGWHVMEGRHCYNATSCSLSGDTLPVTEYSHASGRCSITGGYVYRGPTQTALVGHYVYADFCTGRIYTFAVGASNGQQVLQADTAERITSFGESDDGELYAVTIDGKLFRVLAS